MSAWMIFVPVLSALFAATGLVLNWWQMRKNNIRQRAEFLINMRNKFMTDPEMAEMHYVIEYDNFQYNENFHGSEDERKLDKLLYLFESISRLRLMGNIKTADLEMFAYELLVVHQNLDIQRYFSFLDEWFPQRGIKLVPFKAFLKVGKELESLFYEEHNR